ncbi:MAG: DUF1223 domain-containing protein [Elusimicrobiota bacterium]
MINLLLAAGLAVPAFAGGVAFRSGPARVHLIELYSSEGCSSCPPADAWVGPLKADARVWKDFVPVVFHVDYWDYLGWKDRMASPEFTARQREYAAAWGSRSTYTPGFVLDGKEWRDWGGAAPKAGENAGLLTASFTAGKWKVTFAPVEDAGKYDVFVARLGFGIVTPVTSGENAGRTLHHEFIARELIHARMKKIKGAWTAELPGFSNGADGDASTGAAIWVAGPGGRPEQATGGYLP